MDAVKWPLFLMCLCFKVIQAKASSWTIQVPSSVKGLPGSCVVIPCSFNYPNPEKEVTEFTGIWADKRSHLIYHPVESKTPQQYWNRTSLVGDIRQKNCSLKIDPLQQHDKGPFHFRIEIKDYDNFSYRGNEVSISMISVLNPIKFSVKEEVKEGQVVSASCSVCHSCPTSPPVFNWSHSGKENFQSQQLDDGQWEATSTLTFHPTHVDHKKPLQCNVRYKGGQHQDVSKVLKVKYAPVNVKVEYKKDVKEGETVRLNCSSDAHPLASSYEWHNGTGVQLHKGKLYMLPNVSRHTGGALYCTAINEIGRAQSSPVQLNVLYAPEIKTASSCSSEGYVVKCVCIVESKPPSMVHFELADRVLQSTKVEKHGSLTFWTLQADFGSSEFVYCLANNTQGKNRLTLSLPVKNKMQNIFIATVIFLVILLIAVGVIKKSRGTPRDIPASDASIPAPDVSIPASHVSTLKADRAVELPQYATTKRKEVYDDAHCDSIYTNDPVYGNIGDDGEDAVYVNV